MAGYCFRCDAPAEGEVCPHCGASLYREEKQQHEKSRRPLTVGEISRDRPTRAGRRAMVAFVAVALLLIVMVIVAGYFTGVT
jgi:hypothetical protein